jgi:hypothetical protein
VCITKRRIDNFLLLKPQRTEQQPDDARADQRQYGHHGHRLRRPLVKQKYYKI